MLFPLYSTKITFKCKLGIILTHNNVCVRSSMLLCKKIEKMPKAPRGPQHNICKTKPCWHIARYNTTISDQLGSAQEANLLVKDML